MNLIEGIELSKKLKNHVKAYITPELNNFNSIVDIVKKLEAHIPKVDFIILSKESDHVMPSGRPSCDSYTEF